MRSSILKQSVILGAHEISDGTLAAIRLGKIGRCPEVPNLFIALFDDSGSVSLPGGTDPIGNRYDEAWHAFRELRACSCNQCLIAVRHFDTPSGDAGPYRASRRAPDQLRRSLQVPIDALGSSFLTPSLEAAEQLAGQHPGHAATLLVFTDWQLFDPPEYLERLRAFPGRLVVFGLGFEAPIELQSDNGRRVHIAFEDAPGAVARAVFNGIVLDRSGSTVFDEAHS